jgi:hypothetical protein
MRLAVMVRPRVVVSLTGAGAGPADEALGVTLGVTLDVTLDVTGAS